MTTITQGEEYEAMMKKVEVFIKDGKKVYAIKAYRACTGSSLKESRAVIDELDFVNNGN